MCSTSSGAIDALLRELWWQVDTRGEFHFGGTPLALRVRDSGIFSGRSTHHDRLRTIRTVHERYGIVVDPHTADGVKVALEQRDREVPMICLETAAPAKFADTIIEAIGQTPERPATYADIESRPQRFEPLPRDAEAFKRFIERHAI
jgi:threonine synthase